jgi:hypothetical protein
MKLFLNRNLIALLLTTFGFMNLATANDGRETKPLLCKIYFQEDAYQPADAQVFSDIEVIYNQTLKWNVPGQDIQVLIDFKYVDGEPEFAGYALTMNIYEPVSASVTSGIAYTRRETLPTDVIEAGTIYWKDNQARAWTFSCKISQ